MTRKKLIIVTTMVSILAGIGFFMAVATPIEAQRTIPITRYEFPQDGVVCYRTSYGSYWGSLSCVKK